MPEYWFVVKPDKRDVYEALRRVVARRPGFHIIIDRRTRQGVPPGEERRTAQVWEGDEMLIAETASGEG